MKGSFSYAIILILAVIVAFFVFNQSSFLPELFFMNISSPEFKNNETIPSKFTCQGQNINPKLTVSDIPNNTKSLALIVDDPDAPMGTFTHWLIWNIDPKISVIDENSAPGIQGRNSAGKDNYIGPCPPSGKPHRYLFKLYALDSSVDLPAGTDKSKLLAEITKHTLVRAALIGIYQR